MKLLKNFWHDETAATAIEYGLIAAGISVAIIATVKTLGTSLKTTCTNVNTQLNRAGSSAAAVALQYVAKLSARNRPASDNVTIVPRLPLTTIERVSASQPTVLFLKRRNAHPDVGRLGRLTETRAAASPMFGQTAH